MELQIFREVIFEDELYAGMFVWWEKMMKAGKRRNCRNHH